MENMPLEERAVKFLKIFHVTAAFCRFVESQLYDKKYLKKPILDIGCGDGRFASIAFTEKIDLGVDIDPAKVANAKRLDIYDNVKMASVTELPSPSSFFNTVISNCTMEHVNQLEKAISEISRVLTINGYFLFSVDSEYFNELLFYPNLLRRLGFAHLAEKYCKTVNNFLKQRNILSLTTWKEKMKLAGLRVIDYYYYISPDAMRLIDRLGFVKLILILNNKLWGKDLVFMPRQVIVQMFKRRILRERVFKEAPAGGLFIIAQKIR